MAVDGEAFNVLVRNFLRRPRSAMLVVPHMIIVGKHLRHLVKIIEGRAIVMNFLLPYQLSRIRWHLLTFTHLPRHVFDISKVAWFMIDCFNRTTMLRTTLIPALLRFQYHEIKLGNSRGFYTLHCPRQMI
jgi:hypothetical protein